MAAPFDGTYVFCSQENYEKYLASSGVLMIDRNMLASAKPQITVAVDGDKVTITSASTARTTTYTFTAGQPYDWDAATNKMKPYVTTIEGDTLVSTCVGAPADAATMKFTDDGLVMTMTAQGVTATRTFRRA